MRRVLLALALATALLWTAVAASAGPSAGLDFVECLTGKRPVTSEPRTPREGGCFVTQTVALDGEGSGINDVQSLVASPDGRSLYGVAPSDNAVSVLSTRPLRLQECFSTTDDLRRRGPQPCHLLPHHGTEDAVSGFNDVHFVTVSPDGRSVYTVSRDESIGIFARAPSGKLAYKGCITGNDGRFGSTRNGSCRAIPSATDGGYFSGLAGPRALTVSPDGRFAYVVLGGEGGIATLARAANGSLSFVSCVIGRAPRIVSGSGLTSPCALASTSLTNPNGSGLAAPKRIAISADGLSLYASSARGAIAEFRRDPATGALAFSGCLAAATRGSGPGDPCRYVPQASELAWETGMWQLTEIAVNSAGTALYGVSKDDDSVVSFSRDPATGALAFAERAEMPKPRGLALSKDGASLFVASPPIAAVNRFRLGPGGRMRFLGCLTWSRKAIGPCARARARNGRRQILGYTGFNSLALAGSSLYAAAGRDSALSRLRVR
ncbi:MAG: lactonase family protein [Solirubrobacterales bacterium]